MKKPRIFITGAQGLIGSTLADVLSDKFNVIGFSHSRPVKHTNKWQLITVSSNELVEVVKHLSPNDKDILVHTAAALPSGSLTFEEAGTINHKIDELVLSAFDGCARAIYFSSVAVYGYGHIDNLEINDSSTPNPMDKYAYSKIIGESLFQQYHNTLTLRLSAPFGRRDGRLGLLDRWIRESLIGAPITLIGQGHRQQDYLSSKEIAKIIQLAINNNISGTYIMGRSAPCSMRELAKIVVEIFLSHSEIVFIDGVESNSVKINSTTLHDKCGWKPESIKQAIIEQYEIPHLL